MFDNAENARSITAFLPPPHHANSVHFLITSRSTQWGEIPTVKLGGFTLEEAQEYVEYHLGSQSKEAVAKLVELLGGLPLAMSQAVSYIKAGHSTLEGFAEQFHLNQASLLSHELLEEEEHPKTIGTTLTLCLAQAKVKSPLVERLLGMIAYFAAEGIDVELVQKGLAASKEEVEQALEALENYSLVSRSSGGLQVHRLVQEVMRYRHKFLREPHIYWNRAVELLGDVVFDDDTNIEGMKQCSHAIAHVKQVGELSKKVGLGQEQELKLAGLLAESGRHQQMMGNYGVACAFHEQTLEIRERDFGPDHTEVAITLVSLSNAYYALGNTLKQKELLERALIILERQYGPDHDQVASTLGNLGVAYGVLGDMHKKKELLERVLLLNERHYGPDHAKVAGTLVSLGNSYADLGNARKAKELLERALIIYERHYGPDHAKVAITLVNLGNIYGALGDARKQKELLERALIIQERHFGPDHAEVAMTLANLSNAYGTLEDASKQKELLERALAIQECHFGPDHIRFAMTLASLSTAYGALGNAQKQRELLERALVIKERHFGPNHPEVASTLGNLGIAYGDLGDVHKKKEILERALTIQEQHFGPNHAQVAFTLFNLANACLDLKQLSEAKNYAERTYLTFKEYYGEGHSNTKQARMLLQRFERESIEKESQPSHRDELILA